MRPNNGKNVNYGIFSKKLAALSFALTLALPLVLVACSEGPEQYDRSGPAPLADQSDAHIQATSSGLAGEEGSNSSGETSGEEQLALIEAASNRPIYYGVGAAGVTFDTKRSQTQDPNFPETQLPEPLWGPTLSGVTYYESNIIIFWSPEEQTPYRMIVFQGYQGPVVLAKPLGGAEEIRMSQSFKGWFSAGDETGYELRRQLFNSLENREDGFDCHLATPKECDVNDIGTHYVFEFPTAAFFFSKGDRSVLFQIQMKNPTPLGKMNADVDLITGNFLQGPEVETKTIGLGITWNDFENNVGIESKRLEKITKDLSPNSIYHAFGDMYVLFERNNFDPTVRSSQKDDLLEEILFLRSFGNQYVLNGKYLSYFVDDKGEVSLSESEVKDNYTGLTNYVGLRKPENKPSDDELEKRVKTLTPPKPEEISEEASEEEKAEYAEKLEAHQKRIEEIREGVARQIELERNLYNTIHTDSDRNELQASFMNAITKIVKDKLTEKWTKDQPGSFVVSRTSGLQKDGLGKVIRSNVTFYNLETNEGRTVNINMDGDAGNISVASMGTLTDPFAPVVFPALKEDAVARNIDDAGGSLGGFELGQYVLLTSSDALGDGSTTLHYPDQATFEEALKAAQATGLPLTIGNLKPVTNRVSYSNNETRRVAFNSKEFTHLKFHYIGLEGPISLGVHPLGAIPTTDHGVALLARIILIDQDSGVDGSSIKNLCELKDFTPIHGIRDTDFVREFVVSRAKAGKEELCRPKFVDSNAGNRQLEYAHFYSQGVILKFDRRELLEVTIYMNPNDLEKLDNKSEQQRGDVE